MIVNKDIELAGDIAVVTRFALSDPKDTRQMGSQKFYKSLCPLIAAKLSVLEVCGLLRTQEQTLFRLTQHVAE